MIYVATSSDLEWMVNLSYQKRLQYSIAQPNFWKMAENSNDIQYKYFEEELKNNNIIALCYENKQGFIIGKIITPPEVYDAGLTLMVDDFCVKFSDLWMTIGKKLLQECTDIAKDKGAKQVLVVCGDHDIEKYKLLEDMKLMVASRWYTGTID